MLPEPAGEAEVSLRLAATETGLPLARTFVAAAAATWDYTLDAIEDARLVTSELLTMVIAARPAALVEIVLASGTDGLLLKVHCEETFEAPPVDSFGWLVVTEVSRSLQVRSEPPGMTFVAAIALPGIAE